MTGPIPRGIHRSIRRSLVREEYPAPRDVGTDPDGYLPGFSTYSVDASSSGGASTTTVSDRHPDHWWMSYRVLPSSKGIALVKRDGTRWCDNLMATARTASRRSGQNTTPYIGACQPLTGLACILDESMPRAIQTFG